jgi:ring-1,2-phenylacetyl-CoA epoxidase subunit PaaC
VVDQVDRALAQYLIALGDDELILGHRVSEWCGHAPILEEDIAFANIALDEIGHARLWYQVAAELLGEDPKIFPDQLAFFRGAADFRNMQMVELPNGDWAFSILRQYLFDSFEPVRIANILSDQSHHGAMEVAQKIAIEETYHLRHTEAWIKRLGLGTEDSNRRLQDALEQLWSYSFQFESYLPGEQTLWDNGYMYRIPDAFENWQERVTQFLKDSGLRIPDEVNKEKLSRSEHSSDLTALLADMQQVARLDAEASW